MTIPPHTDEELAERMYAAAQATAAASACSECRQSNGAHADNCSKKP